MLTIQLPAQKTHKEKDESGSFSPVCKYCRDCACFEDRVYDLCSYDEFNHYSGTRSKLVDEVLPRVYCKQCRPFNKLEYYKPWMCHCMNMDYEEVCQQCNKKIIEDGAIEFPRESKIPCDSFAWDWTLAQDRGQNLEQDFDLDYNYKLLETYAQILPKDVVNIICDYLTLDLDYIPIPKHIIDTSFIKPFIQLVVEYLGYDYDNFNTDNNDNCDNNIVNNNNITMLLPNYLFTCQDKQDWYSELRLNSLKYNIIFCNNGDGYCVVKYEYTTSNDYFLVGAWRYSNVDIEIVKRLFPKAEIEFKIIT